MIDMTMHRCAGNAARAIRRILAACAAIGLLGCATNPNGTIERTAEDRVERGKVLRSLNLEPALEDRILALDPDHISDYDVRKTLASGPTPRIILLHASVYPVYLIMSSFATFLEGMGYPGEKLRDPADGAYSQSPYGSSERLAGEIAWYYEHDGVRPMIVGHSQGGMQAIKVLYTLAGAFEPKVAVWNAATDAAEDRFSIVDPLDGSKRAVVGLSVTYATAVGAGGAAFMLPNQWDMLLRLRTIPDTVDDFTGFAIQGDMIAWTFPATTAVSEYRRGGAATVRNVILPMTYNHITVPITHALAADPKARAWINAYVPGTDEEPKVPADVRGLNILWAADVWFSIKKHWCLEAQTLIRAKRAALANDHELAGSQVSTGRLPAPD
jgi:pimeloyl-ACP methyl ester carboxylesterase